MKKKEREKNTHTRTVTVETILKWQGLKIWPHKQASVFVTFACSRWYAPNTFPPFTTIVAPFNCSIQLNVSMYFFH